MKTAILALVLTASLLAGTQDAGPQDAGQQLYTMYVVDNYGTVYNIGTQSYDAWLPEIYSLETNAIPRHEIEGFYLVPVASPASRLPVLPRLGIQR